MSKKIKILFVCSGNIFRSFSAEKLSQKYLEDNKINDILVSSTGTHVGRDPPYQQTLDRVTFHGGKIEHKRRQITKEICQESDVIICMATWHQDFVKKLGFDSILFNEIAYNKNENLLDESEYGEQHGWNYDLTKYIDNTVDYIYDSIPQILEAIQKWQK